MSIPILTREQFLSVQFMAEVIKNNNNYFALQEGLKEQAKQNKIPIGTLNEVIKHAKIHIKNQETLQNNEIIDPSDIQQYLPPDLRAIHDKLNFDDYVITKNGILYTLNKLLITVCPQPIFVTQRLKDIETQEEYLTLHFLNNNQAWQELLVSRIQVSTTRNIVELSRKGFIVNDQNAGYVIKYLADFETLNNHLIPSTLTTSTIGKTKHGYIPYDENIIYAGDNADNQKRFNLYKQHGSYDTWLDNQISSARYKIPRILIGAAYSSILLQELGHNPYGVHLWGGTGFGKSLALMVAASIYGAPSINDGIVYTGNSTANGLESRLAFVKSYCFFLDELSLLSPKQIDDMIMLIMQGQGKLRMLRSGASANTHNWRCVSITNAEKMVTSDLSIGGVYNRVIQISPTAPIFQHIQQGEHEQFADSLRENYGFGAPKFIRAINGLNKSEITRRYREHYDNVYSHDIEDKQAASAALLLAAYELANTTVYDGKLTPLTSRDIIPHLHTKSTVSQVLRIHEKLQDHVEANYNFFDNSDLPTHQQKWGRITENGVDILPARLDEFLKKIAENNITAQQFISGLIDHKLINLPSDGKYQKTARIQGSTKRVYSVLFCNTETYEKVLQKQKFNSNSLPF